MGETEDDIRQADLRNGEPDATEWTETDRPPGEDRPSAQGATADRAGEPVPSEADELDQEPSPGRLPSDTDVQAERQP